MFGTRPCHKDPCSPCSCSWRVVAKTSRRAWGAMRAAQVKNMSQPRLNHVSTTQPGLNHVSTMSQPCLNHVSTTQPCLNHVSTMSQPCLNHVSTVSQPCLNHVSTMSQPCPNKLIFSVLFCVFCLSTTPCSSPEFPQHMFRGGQCLLITYM